MTAWAAENPRWIRFPWDPISVIVSFAGVDTVTTSFVNAAFVPFLETIGFEAFKRRVRIVDATRPTIDLIKHRMNFEARRHAAA